MKPGMQSKNQCDVFLRSFSMPRNHNSMGYANHMQEIFHPCPPDEKSESEAILSIACFPFMFSL